MSSEREDEWLDRESERWALLLSGATHPVPLKDEPEYHVGHMTECTACTWWYCDHYPCDCHESCVGRHDAEGNPV